MSFTRGALLLILPAALAAFSPLFADTVPESAAIKRHVYFKATTPLAEIPVYSLAASSPDAMRGLETEIDRLYTHATTLPSGPDRRAFETRIYQLEKRLRPLAKQFDAKGWTDLRAAVRLEWESVQASLPAVGGAPVVSSTTPAPAT